MPDVGLKLSKFAISATELMFTTRDPEEPPNLYAVGKAVQNMLADADEKP
jgi:hypothetical protein